MNTDRSTGDVDDARTSDQIRYDAICDQVVEATRLVRLLSERLEKLPGGQVQTVIHKTAGTGPFVVAAIVACFATWIGLLVLALWESNLWAWKDIHDHRISVLEAKGK